MNQSRKDKNQLQENQNDYNYIINFLSKVFTNTFDTRKDLWNYSRGESKSAASKS